jgi:U4/U6.U5 tri-snRNP-associated protein 2
MLLGLDLPAPPLFQDERQQNMIPQVPLFELLNKFNGITEHEYKTYKVGSIPIQSLACLAHLDASSHPDFVPCLSQDTFVKRFQLLDMPDYLVIHVKRFTKNSFFIEKNPTIVNFPVKCVAERTLSWPRIPGHSEGCRVNGQPCSFSFFHRNLDFRDYVEESHRKPGKSYRYNLICNIVHEGQPGAGKGTYRAHVYHKVGMDSVLFRFFFLGGKIGALRPPFCGPCFFFVSPTHFFSLRCPTPHTHITTPGLATVV